MTGRFDLAIVGGGIIGCATAWAALRAGLKRVVVLERHAIGAAATSRAAALLTRPRPKTAQIPLVLETYDAIGRLAAELDDDLGLHRHGSLHVAALPARRAELDALESIARDFGFRHARIDAAEAARRAPWLDAAGAEVLFLPDDAVIDPYRLAAAYAQAARRRGAEFRVGVGADRLILDSRRVTGVATRLGPVPADRVALAVGAWAGVLAAEAGVAIPMAPVRSTYWITADARLPRAMPFAVLPDAGAYVRPELGGLVIGLREAQSLSIDARTLPAVIDGFDLNEAADGPAILADGADRLRRFLPKLDALRFQRFIAGLSTYTPDGQFVIGRAPGVDGLLIASGCCGAGIAASGGFGAAIAALAMEQEPPFDLAPFDPARFGAIDPFDPGFRARCAAARSAKSSG